MRGIGWAIGSAAARARREAPAVVAGYAGPALRRRVAAGAFCDTEILAWRPMGFGSRIGELLNAMRMARALDARLVFCWPPAPQFDVRAVEHVFGERFIREHHLSACDPAKYGTLSTHVHPSDLRRLHAGAARGARMQERYEVTLHGVGLRLPSFAEAFAQIEFHPRLERIREQIRSLPPVAVAMHVRRWDVAVPQSRFGGVFSLKQLPLVILRRAAGAVMASGHGAGLVIGNDPEFTSLVARSTRARTTAEMLDVDPTDVDAIVFRDFCALTRAENVIGGTSAFARVARLVGDSRVVDGYAMLGSAEARTLLMDAALHPADDVPPLEATLASDHLFQVPGFSLTLSEEIALLERTTAIDPEDPTRWLGLAARLARVGDADRVEECLDALDRHWPGRTHEALALARRGTTRSGHLTSREWSELQRHRPDWVSNGTPATE